VDPAGRIIFHTCDPIYRYDEGYKKGVVDMLKLADADSESYYRNGMVQFPVHVWRETLPRMRQHVSELHGGTSFLDVYMNTEASICEFCLIASYGYLHEGDKYTVTDRACPSSLKKEYASNLFQKSATHGLPMVGTMQHENPKNRYSCDSCWIKGCCLTYRISSDEAEECANIEPKDFCEMNICGMILYSDYCHTTGDSPELLGKHFELVWRDMDQRSVASIQDGKEKCLTKIRSLKK